MFCQNILCIFSWLLIIRCIAYKFLLFRFLVICDLASTRWRVDPKTNAEIIFLHEFGKVYFRDVLTGTAAHLKVTHDDKFDFTCHRLMTTSRRTRAKKTTNPKTPRLLKKHCFGLQEFAVTAPRW